MEELGGLSDLATTLCLAISVTGASVLDILSFLIGSKYHLQCLPVAYMFCFDNTTFPLGCDLAPYALNGLWLQLSAVLREVTNFSYLVLKLLWICSSLWVSRNSWLWRRDLEELPACSIPCGSLAPQQYTGTVSPRCTIHAQPVLALPLCANLG
jgi:hypothetical protein